MIRDLFLFVRVIVGGVLVRVGRTIAGPEPESELEVEDEPGESVPMGHPVVSLGVESRRMIAEGAAPTPSRKPDPPKPLRGSVAARFGARS